MSNIAYNIDCMEYMRTLPDKFFDLAVVDPPYGGGSRERERERDGLCGGCGEYKGAVVGRFGGRFTCQRKSCDQCWDYLLYADKMRPYDYKAWHLETRILTHQIVNRAAFGLKNLIFNKRYKIKE